MNNDAVSLDIYRDNVSICPSPVEDWAVFVFFVWGNKKLCRAKLNGMSSILVPPPYRGYTTVAPVVRPILYSTTCTLRSPNNYFQEGSRWFHCINHAPLPGSVQKRSKYRSWIRKTTSNYQTDPRRTRHESPLRSRVYLLLLYEGGFCSTPTKRLFDMPDARLQQNTQKN